MTNLLFHVIVVTKKKKVAEEMPGKEITMRNTFFRIAELDSKRYEALSKEQGLYFVCSYKIRRTPENCVIMEEV